MPKSEDTWYALRTYYSQEQKVGGHLDRYSLQRFIPMRTVLKADCSGPTKKARKSQVPYVHNLIFIKRPQDLQTLESALAECPYATSVYSQPESGEWCPIPESDILDLRIICDQSFTEPIFLTEEECDMVKGSLVEVTHGPLKGIRAILVRKNKKYYVVKEITGARIMVQVSRWCCKKI